MTAAAKIGIDLGGSKIAVVLLSTANKILFEKRIDTPKNNYQGVIDAICKLVIQARELVDNRTTVGLGIPGSIAPGSGLIQNANSVWLNGQRFQRDLEKQLGNKVKIANDANCLALSESFDGSAQQAKNVFAVIIGTGCGGAIMLENKIVAGRHAIAGEWGHTPLPWPKPHELPGPKCWCGQKNCIETWVSGSGLERDYKAVTGKFCNAKQIEKSAINGDFQSQQALDNHCDRLARGLAAITNIFDPDVIVLGGGLSNMPHLYELLPEKMTSYVFAEEFNANIVSPMHGDASGVRGAARLWD